MSRTTTSLIDYRWAEGRIDRMPELAADLAQREVAVLVTVGNAPARAAKAVTATVPIVFGVGEDPVEVRSCRKPRPARAAT